jgi:hypothetical protein
MNIIWNKLNEYKPKYWFHIEDDWLFVKPFNIINTSIQFLEKYSDQNIYQILFNKNYAETFNDIDIIGGKRLDDQYILHIKDEEGLKGKNCAYWPHYSFRPSICLTEKILEIGNFDSENTFFEREFADKYFNKGYQSAFYNEIMSIHTGRLTSERNDNDKKNAYQLNNVNQFSPQTFFDAHSVTLPDGTTQLLQFSESLYNIGFDFATYVDTTTGQLGGGVDNLMEYEVEFACNSAVYQCDMWRTTTVDPINNLVYFQAHYAPEGMSSDQLNLYVMGFTTSVVDPVPYPYINVVVESMVYGYTGYQFVLVSN